MRRTQTIVALSLTAIAIVGGFAGATEPANPPAAAQPATPAVDGPKITKSRSNIQNNRQSAPAPAAGPQKSVVKTKTKSNQSND